MSTATRIALALALLAACHGRPADRPPTAPVNATQPPVAHRVDFRDVSFVLDPRVADDFAPASVPATELGSPTDKPDGVSPAYFGFRFGPDATASWQKDYRLPDLERAGVYVFPADGYRTALSGAGPALDQLAAILLAAKLPPDATLPFVPFVDASVAFAARPAFVDFVGGNGVLVLTELMIEPTSAGKQLAFVFQGLSGDRKTYVLAIFPAHTAASIPKMATDDKQPWDMEKASAAFEPYLATVAAALNAAPDDAFSPDPSVLRTMLATLTLPAPR